MLRFVALSWNPASENATSEADQSYQLIRAQSEEWACALRVHGLIVLHIGGDRLSAEVRMLAGARGVILGRVFVRRTLRGDARLEDLVDAIWGRYVTFESGTAPGSLDVLRG